MDKDELIGLILSAPAIWNKRHRQHHNQYVLAREWKKLATQLGVTENDAQSCWKNLRQEFGKQLTKIQGRLGDAASDENETHWPYFHELRFLRNQFTPRCMSSSLIAEPNEILTQDTVQIDVNLEVSDESDRNDSTISSLPNVPSPLSESQTINPVPMSIPSMSGSKYSVTQTGYKRRITAHEEIGKQLVDLEKQKLALKANKIGQGPNDEDIGFFNSPASCAKVDPTGQVYV